jgi:tRNA threonylcarbamoyladenosine biosynthesis protein TsaB
MLTLAIDTSGPTGSIALRRNGELLAERTLELGKQHGQSLIPAIRELLQAEGETVRRCGLIAVSIGPGSFTGLRVGVVCAKTLAYAIPCPVVPVDTFQAIAANAPTGVSVVHVAANAQRGELFVARFRRTAEGDWERCGSTEILQVAILAARLQTGDVVLGPDLEFAEDGLGTPVRLLTGPIGRPRADEVARLGERLLAAGKAGNAGSIVPVYLRRSSAEDKWEQRREAGR